MNADLQRLAAKTAAKAEHAARLAAFRCEFVPLRPRLVKVAWARTHNWYDAEDLAQDVLLRALRRVIAGECFHNPSAIAYLMLRDALGRLYRERAHLFYLKEDSDAIQTC